MTQQPSSQPDTTTGRYPLSYIQQYFHSLDESDLTGALGNRFTIVSAVRIAGHADIATLQAALDDVVPRHELLRTVVIRDTQPPNQQVHPPCRVPLEIQDGPADGQARDLVAEELIIEAEQETMMPQQVPVVRASLTRFDDSDSVLVLVVHHSASGAWSRVIILLPNDRPRPEVCSRPFSAYYYVVRADEMAAARSFALEMRSADGAAMFLKRMLPSSGNSDIPSSMIRSMSADSSGDLNGNVVYNLDEFDERKAAGRVSDYNRILLELASEPDREWRQLKGIAL